VDSLLEDAWANRRALVGARIRHRGLEGKVLRVEHTEVCDGRDEYDKVELVYRPDRQPYRFARVEADDDDLSVLEVTA
jgi:hypothetical protein